MAKASPTDFQQLLSCAARVHCWPTNFPISPLDRVNGLSLLDTCLGIHYVTPVVHLLSLRLTTWPAHVHFYFFI